ncbi:MAG: ribonuclease HII [SAR202 cluster bacterium]|nr:ribonuclease HII [SAR202 cluster bacterium]
MFGQGFTLVAGLDEAGRGPIAGPVVAGVAVLPQDLNGEWVSLLRDSKQMTEAEREEAYGHLERHAVGIGAGVGTTSEIDSKGIVSATRLAMSRALKQLPFKPEFLLLDAFPLPGVNIRQKAIVHGDALCLSIAAASIVAKVTRDRMMLLADAEFPMYGFASHKGYASEKHMAALADHGPCSLHRFSFEPVYTIHRTLGIAPPHPIREKPKQSGFTMAVE